MTYPELIMKLIVFITILIIGLATTVSNKIYRAGICILLLNSLIILVIAAMLLVFDKNTLLIILYVITIFGSILTISITRDNKNVSKESTLLVTRVCVGLCVFASAIAIFFYL